MTSITRTLTLSLSVAATAIFLVTLGIIIWFDLARGGEQTYCQTATAILNRATVVDLSRVNLGQTRRPSGGIIDAGRGFCKALIDAERQSVFVLCFLDCRVGWRAAATALSIEGLAATIALDIHLQNRGVMDKAIDGGERHSWSGKILPPNG